MDKGLIFLISLGVFVFGLLVIAIVHDCSEHERLMAECIKDHKEYECVSMLKSGSSGTTVVPMPIIIPRR